MIGGRGCAVTEPLPGRMGQRAGREHQRRHRRPTRVCDSNVRPQLERDDPLNLSISISGGKKLTRIPLVTASEVGTAQAANLRPRGRRIVVWRRLLSSPVSPAEVDLERCVKRVTIP